MGLFGWVVVGNSSQSARASTSSTQAGVGKPINHADYKQFGLENFGNTCYANSILQALYFCQPFRDLICEAYDSSNPPIPQSVISPPVKTPAPPPSRGGGRRPFRRRDSTHDTKTNDDSQANGHATPRGLAPSATVAPAIPMAPPSLFSALRSLFLHIATNANDKGKISPTAFIEKVKAENPDYRSTMHQDAHEFLGFLLNKVVEDIEAEWKKAAENPPQQDLASSLGSLTSTTLPSNSSGSQRQFSSAKTFVHALFEGILTSETRCLSCETVSSRDESFLDLSIDIEQNSSVTACLRQFSASEMLSQKNKFFCDCCGSLQEAEKRMKIKKLPNVLALHLKRFKYQEDLQRYIKLSYRVAFPFELRLFNTVDDAPDPDRLYQLFAIVVHIGNGPNHGHYISIVRAHGSWLVFDDDNVDPVRETDISKYFGESQNGAGYVLFYQAVDLEGLGPFGDPTAEEKSAAVDVDAEPNVRVSITANDTSASVPDGSSPEVAIVVQDEPKSHVALERHVPTKLAIPASIEDTAMDAPTPVASTGARLAHEASTSAMPTAKSSASVVNGFSETATVSSDSSTGAPGLFVQVGETSSLATTQASLSPTKASLSTSPASSGNFFVRTLKHSQSAKVVNGDNEKDKRRTASNGGANGMSATNDDIPPVPPSPSLTRSKSFFSSKRKSDKEKERLAIPTPRTSIGGTSSSPISSVDHSESAPIVSDIPGSTTSGSLPNGKALSVIPSSSSTERTTSGKSKLKSSRPSTAPSSATKSAFDDPLPPIPASPQQQKLSQGASSSSIASSLAFPSSPVPPSPSRKASQHLPPPVSMPPAVASSLTEHPPSTSSNRVKRISRKSLTGLSLTAMFGRKEKEKASDNMKDDNKSPIIPRRPSLMASGS